LKIKCGFVISRRAGGESLIGDVRNPARCFTSQGMSEAEDFTACPMWDGGFFFFLSLTGGCSSTSLRNCYLAS